jgi:hypothetical protein
MATKRAFMKHPTLGLAVVAFSAASCGGEIASRVEAWCHAKCVVESSCRTGSADCEENCLNRAPENGEAILGRVTEVYWNNYVSCLRNVAATCKNLKDPPVETAYPENRCPMASRADLPISPSVSAYCSGMQSKAVECADNERFMRFFEGGMGRYGGPECAVSVRIFTDEHLQTAIDCLGQPCADAIYCVVSLLEVPQ